MPSYSQIALLSRGDGLPNGRTKTGSSDGTMLIFPGAQTQYKGMLASCRDLPIVQEMLEIATDIFGFDVERAMREGELEDCTDRVDRSQMLAYVADCAALEVLRETRPEAADGAKAVAGFSVGEFAALVAAGVLTYEQGLTIVRARAEAMRRWEEEAEMAALGVYGLHEDMVLKLCQEARIREKAEGRRDPQAYISHCWGRLGFTCSGRTATLRQLARVINEHPDGQQAFVHIVEKHKDASHTPMAEAVSESLESVVKEMKLQPPRCEVYFCSGHRVLAGEWPEMFLPRILQHLETPVRWEAVVATALERNIRSFVEVGAGKSLKELMVFNTWAGPDGEVRPYELTTSICV